MLLQCIVYLRYYRTIRTVGKISFAIMYLQHKLLFIPSSLSRITQRQKSSKFHTRKAANEGQSKYFIKSSTCKDSHIIRQGICRPANGLQNKHYNKKRKKLARTFQASILSRCAMKFFRQDDRGKSRGGEGNQQFQSDTHREASLVPTVAADARVRSAYHLVNYDSQKLCKKMCCYNFAV